MIRQIEIKTLEGQDYSIEYEIKDGHWVILEALPIVKGELGFPISRDHSDWWECEQLTEEDFMANIDDLVQSLVEDNEERKGDDI